MPVCFFLSESSKRAAIAIPKILYLSSGSLPKTMQEIRELDTGRLIHALPQQY